MKNGILRSLGACTLLLFICFSSVLTAKNIIGHSHIAPTIWGLPISSSPFSENIKGNLNLPLEDVTAPTAALTYPLDGSVVSSVKQDDVVIITATFSEAMADSPVVQILGSGVNSISASDMTKVSTTSYTYSWTVGSGDGIQTFALATGTDT